MIKSERPSTWKASTVSDQSVTGKLPFKHRSLTFDEVPRPVTPFLRLGTPTVFVMFATSLGPSMSDALCACHCTLTKVLVQLDACIVKPRSASRAMPIPRVLPALLRLLRLGHTSGPISNPYHTIANRI
jgi:hypothetical protein